MEDDAVLRNGHALRVEDGEPGWWGGGRRGEVHHHAALVKEGDDAVKPVEVVLTWSWFQLCPGEDPQRDQVHPGLAHQAYVFVPDLLGPLLRVVVPAVDHVRDLMGDHNLTSCGQVVAGRALPGVIRAPEDE